VTYEPAVESTMVCSEGAVMTQIKMKKVEQTN
jgi:hypothetical protein